MKLLMINTEKGWRGGERQTLLSARAFLEAGLRVIVLCRKGQPLYKKCKSEGVKTQGVSSQAEAFMYLSMRGKYYDLLHCQTAKAQSLAVFSKPFHKTRILYTRRVDFVPSGISSWIKYRFTDKTVAISQAIAAILKQAGVKDVTVIPSMVSPRTLDPARARSYLKTKGLAAKHIIGTTATLVPHKDPLTMIRAVSELSQQRSDFIFLHFGDGELKEEAEAEITELGLQELYHLEGYVSDADDFFALFDLFVMSSREEGLGSSVLDAFIHKVPVVSTDAGGLKELVTGRGLVVPKESPQLLAEAMNQLLEPSQMRSEFLKSAFETVSTTYSKKETTRSYLNLFGELIHEQDE